MKYLDKFRNFTPINEAKINYRRFASPPPTWTINPMTGEKAPYEPSPTSGYTGFRSLKQFSEILDKVGIIEGKKEIIKRLAKSDSDREELETKTLDQLGEMWYNLGMEGYQKRGLGYKDPYSFNPDASWVSASGWVSDWGDDWHSSTQETPTQDDKDDEEGSECEVCGGEDDEGTGICSSCSAGEDDEDNKDDIEIIEDEDDDYYGDGDEDGDDEDIDVKTDKLEEEIAKLKQRESEMVKRDEEKAKEAKNKYYKSFWDDDKWTSFWDDDEWTF